MMSVRVLLMCCGIVQHNYRKSFMEELSHLLGLKFSQFISLYSVGKTSFVFGSELWEENFSALLTHKGLLSHAL